MNIRQAILALFAAALCVALLAGCSKKNPWITDIAEAKDTSTSSGKDLLVVFSDTGTNESSKALFEKALTKDFVKKAKKTYVLCNIDILQSETPEGQALAEKNYMAAATYGVQALPTVVLATSSGDIYGFAAPDAEVNTPEAFLTFLETFTEARTKLVDLKAKIEAGTGLDRAASIDTFLGAVNPFHRNKYTSYIREYPALDPQNTSGKLGNYLIQIAYLDAIDAYQTGNLTGAGDAFFAASENPVLSPAQKQESIFMGAYLYAESGTIERDQIITWLEKAVAIDPASPESAKIKTTLESLKNDPSLEAAPSTR